MPNNKMERFTQRARRVLSLAQESAERFHHTTIDAHHILVGLVKEESGVAGQVLRNLGVETARLENIVEQITPPNLTSNPTRAELSNLSKRVLEMAVDEARRMGHHFIGTEHLLLALVRPPEGTAIEALKQLNITSEEVREQTRRVLQESPMKTRRSTPVAHFAALPITAERFSERAAHVITLAGEIAVEFDHNLIATEHLLLGIMRESHGVGARVLRDLAVMPERAEKLMVELSTVKVTPRPSTLEYSPNFKRVLELAADEARHLQTPRRLEKHLIDTEHLLLGLVRQTEGVAIDILKRLGVTPEEIRRQTRRTLQESPIPPEPPWPEAPRPPKAASKQPNVMPAQGYELLETLLIKLMQMLEDNKISTPHAVELLSTLMPDIKLTPSQQAELVSQLFDAPRFKRYIAHLKVADAQGAEISAHSMSFTELLAEIDSFLSSALNDPNTPFIFKLGSTSLEIKLERTDDNPNEAVL